MSAMAGGNDFQFASLGKKLSLARETRGLSIEQISKITRIRSQMLRHLEADDFTQFPHPSYLRLYLMDYARFLDVPFQDIRDWLPDAGTPGSENYEYITGLGTDDAGQVRKEYFYPRGKGHPTWQRAIRVVLVLAVIGLVASVYAIVRDLGRIGAAGESKEATAANVEPPVVLIGVATTEVKAAAVTTATTVEAVSETLSAEDSALLSTPAELTPNPSAPEVSPALETSTPILDQQANLSLSNPPMASAPSGTQVQ